MSWIPNPSKGRGHFFPHSNSPIFICMIARSLLSNIAQQLLSLSLPPLSLSLPLFALTECPCSEISAYTYIHFILKCPLPDLHLCAFSLWLMNVLLFSFTLSETSLLSCRLSSSAAFSCQLCPGFAVISRNVFYFSSLGCIPLTLYFVHLSYPLTVNCGYPPLTWGLILRTFNCRKRPITLKHLVYITYNYVTLW